MTTRHQDAAAPPIFYRAHLEASRQNLRGEQQDGNADEPCPAVRPCRAGGVKHLLDGIGASWSDQPHELFGQTFHGGAVVKKE